MPSQELRIRRVAIDTWRESVVYLHRDCVVVCAKTSSRAITSPAGTADTMAVLGEVDLPIERLQPLERDTNGCLGWGGSAALSPADDILISVERPLGIDPPGGTGWRPCSARRSPPAPPTWCRAPRWAPSAKVRSMPATQRLRKLFELVAGSLNRHVEVMLIDGILLRRRIVRRRATSPGHSALIRLIEGAAQPRPI